MTMPVFRHCRQMASSPHQAISIGRDSDFVSKSKSYQYMQVNANRQGLCKKKGYQIFK